MIRGPATRNKDYSQLVDMLASYPSVTICKINLSSNDRFYISALFAVGPTLLFLPDPQFSTEHSNFLQVHLG